MVTPQVMKKEDAVSPVIGVILMVAITVILAAIIAMFVFSMTDSVGGGKVVGMTVTADNTDVKILWQGGQDIATLNGISGSVGETDFLEVPITPTVGRIDTINTTEIVSGNRTILVGHFKDGHTQILFDKVM